MSGGKIKLSGKTYSIVEPCFCRLKRIISLFNSLSYQGSDTEFTRNLNLLFIELLGRKNALLLRWPWNRPTVEEVEQFILEVPAICGLTQKKSNVIDDESFTSDSINEWDALYALIIDRTGWDWDAIDQRMTLSRLEALKSHWKKSPPVNELVAAYLDYKPPADGDEMTIEQRIRQLQQFNATMH
ncbi:MAG: hypothetical protein M0R47_16855 [Methylobacter sp.]|uniref:hypothetical protein n=1 Tax=Methylobacter sp. TaxID=2051955 RepID=UPI0025E12E6D|nr:hypothetical protein [Methylobacter sp.]MCK9622193.1 hypothetical protein [Methylobacter sp.]